METLLPILPLVKKYNGKIMVETLELIMPPNYNGVFQIGVDTGKINFTIGFYIADFYEYDPVNDVLLNPISTTDAGLYRESEHFKWGFIPLINSIARQFIPDFSISRKASENVYVLVNNSDIYIYFTMTIFMIEFDRGYENEIREYIEEGVFKL